MVNKGSFSEGLVEDVRHLLIRQSSFYDYVLVFHMLTKMMEQLVDVLCLWMYFWEIGKLQSTAVVFKHSAMYFGGQVVDL